MNGVITGNHQPTNSIEDSPILCIFLCEFHHKEGPKITFQVPEDYVSKEDFDSLSAYLIPKQELQGRLIIVNARKMKLIGYPCGLENSKKYSRNRLIFNLCFVTDASKRTMQYEALCKKMAHYLLNLEKESEFLFDEEMKSRLPLIMSKIREDLNANKYCTLKITPSVTIDLKVHHVHPEPKQVEDHDVPIFSSYEVSMIPSQWDLTTQQILPFIDGYRHVAKIAVEVDVEVSLVKACIQNMMYYGIISLIPIFQYSNVYMPTSHLVRLVEDEELQDECLHFVAKQDCSPPSFRSVFQFYCGMNPGVAVRDLCTRFNPQTLGIDEKKLIRFGLTKGLIRRLYKYPVFICDDQSFVSSQRGAFRFFDGNNNFDKICCKTGKTYQELDDSVEKHPSVVVIWK